MAENLLKPYLVEIGSGDKPLPEIAATYKGRNVIVCGDARCLWEDLENFGARSDVGRGRVFKDGWDIMVINRVVETMPANIEHMYSNEPESLKKFQAARRYEYTKEFSAPRFSHSHQKGADFCWPLGGHGTSGLGAVLVAVGLGYDQVVLCGLSLDNSPHNGEPHWRRCNFEREAAPNVSTGVNPHWQRAIKTVFNGKVKSMSGRTRAWLGEPKIKELSTWI